MAWPSAIPANAVSVTYEITKPDLWGRINQLDPKIMSVFGDCACAPTASINSFIYLMEKYPVDGLIRDYDDDGDVDGVDHVAAVIELGGYMELYKKAEPYTDSNGNGQWDPGEPYTDRNGNGSWDDEEYTDSDGDGHRDLGEPYDDLNGNGQWDPGEPYTDEDGDGKRDPREPGVCDGCSDDDMVAGKKKWIEEYNKQPDTLDIIMKLAKTPPTWQFIYHELKRCEDVEFGLTWPRGGGHWVTATGFKFVDADGDKKIDPGESATLSFVDPVGGVPLTGTLSMDDGFLSLNYSGGAAGTGGTGKIDIVLSESPVPEPVTMLGVFLGVSGLSMYIRKRKIVA